MSDKRIVELRDDLVDATTEVVWRQWKAIGASAGAKEGAASIVDPEALIHMSLSLLSYELRLADLVAGWMAINSSLLSVQRMKNIAREFPEKVRGRLPEVARVGADDGKDARWASLVKEGVPALASRGNKARAVRHHFTAPAALMLQLRLGMGVGAKADVLAFLLGTDRSVTSTSVIAGATGYTVTAARRAADEMAAARFIRAVESPDPANRAQTIYFAFKDPWATLLESESALPEWRDWKDYFAFVAEFLDWETEVQGRTVSPYALGERGGRMMKRHSSVFYQVDFVSAKKTPKSDDAAEHFVESARRVARWMVKNA